MSNEWTDADTTTASTRLRLQGCHAQPPVSWVPDEASPAQRFQLQNQNFFSIWVNYGSVIQTNCGNWTSWGRVPAHDYRFELVSYNTQSNSSSWFTACCFAANPVTIEW